MLLARPALSSLFIGCGPRMRVRWLGSSPGQCPSAAVVWLAAVPGRRVAPPPQLGRPGRLYGLGAYRGDLRARAADSYNSLKSHIRSSLLYRISYIATARQRRFDAVCGHRRKYFFRSPQKLRGVFYLYVPQRLSPESRFRVFSKPWQGLA